jgi:eukaryotic-like serine/threonine-protein kinase
MPDLKAGTVVASRYRLRHLLGEGGMGEVWAATHVVTGKQVALKALKAEKATRPDLVQRFFREARAATVVGHANVVEVHDVFSFAGVPVMVMELLEGESLRERLRRDGTLSVTELVALLVPVVSAVGTAHARGIVHRDLKPENVFLVPSLRQGFSPKVLDFGIAKLAAEDIELSSMEMTRTGSLIGTPYYMAPEQAAGERDNDHRCDVWALGVLAFECLSGRRPFEGENFGQIFKRIITEPVPSLAALRPDLPSEITSLVDGMLVKEREGRRELADVLTTLSQHGSTSAPPFAAPFSRLAATLTDDPTPLAGMDDSALATLPEPTLASAGAPKLEPSTGTLDATTRAQPAPSRAPLSRAQSRVALGAAALALLGLGATAAWTVSRSHPRADATVAVASVAPSSPALAAVSKEPLVVAEPAPSALPLASAPIEARRSVANVAPTRAKVEAPVVASAAPLATPKRLPGGILDQEKAPF